ncbi:MAG TPA: ribulose-phosphate 3-epimerase [Solirubrobacteraceae bacterium]|nr:ribulose-phosphate 3-epimerase [Solirubrobacteraceae bacterium]
MPAPYPEGVRVAPSILSADFARLGDQVDALIDAGARVVHIDVMDGHFVPPITIGPLVVEALRDRVHAKDGFLDVHLMIERPERQVEAFAEAGADSITAHFEATPHVHYAVQQIQACGCHAGVAITPSTPAEVVEELLDELDLVLCMSVNPGWGGQPFIAHTADKLARLRALLPDRIRLEVDGGVHDRNAQTIVEAGADLLVAGSGVFGADDPPAAYRALAAAAGAG